MPGAYLLALDQGTTGSTALVFDEGARVIGRGYREFPQHYPQPGWVSHDPRDLWHATLAAACQALRHARIRPQSLRAIGITNQRETTLLWSRRTSRPIAPAIVWQCRRTAPLCEQLKRRGLEPLFQRTTGLRLDAYFSGTKIRWLLDHVAGARRAAERGELAFGTVDTWLLWQLTGGMVHATDYTNASRTLLLNLHTRRWDARLARILGVPRAVLPELKSSAGFFGETVRNDVLPSGIPIFGIAGDQQASLVGHGCVAPGTAKNTYGTGCFLLLYTGLRLVHSRHGLLSTVACDARGRPAYALEGSIFIAGAAIQWLRDALRLITQAAQSEAIARRTRDTGGVYMVPAFVGLGAPYWDMHARGAIVGLTRGSSREVIIRATLESLAYQTKDVIDAMQRDSGVALRRLQVDGGAANNHWLMQFQADLLGVPVVRPRLVENTARGAAILAGIGAGIWKDATMVTRHDRPDRAFRPRWSARERARRYAGWQAAVRRVRTNSA